MNYRKSSFEEVADALADRGLAILDQFLDPEEQDSIFKSFNTFLEQEAFRRAGIGNSYLYTKDVSIRSDEIMWLADQPQDPALAHFVARIKDLMQELNALLFLSLRDVEMHLALYSTGAHYDKHVDQFKNNGHRILSFAFYLNPDWQLGDGGELRVWNGDLFEDYAPLAGRLAIFRSDTVAHEVLEANKERRSITGWMLDRPKDYPIQE